MNFFLLLEENDHHRHYVNHIVFIQGSGIVKLFSYPFKCVKIL